jgi:acetylglutamate kinase
MSAQSQVRDTIVRLLSNIGSAKEIQQYLKRFSQRDASRFAVVKVGGAILRDDLDALVSSLGFLQQVGLTPIVIHGAGPQLDAELEAAGCASARQPAGDHQAVLKTVQWPAHTRTCVWSSTAGAGHPRGLMNSGVLEAKLLDIEVRTGRQGGQRCTPCCVFSDQGG